jgi:hypothetical protein
MMRVPVPEMPDAVARICAAPADTPCTTPLEETVAIDGVRDDQEMLWPDMTFPDESLTTARAWLWCPTVNVEESKETDTDATPGAGGGGGGGIA